MKLALILDAPRASGPFAGVTGAYLIRLLEACATAAGAEVPELLDPKPFFAVTEQQPGSKAPPIADVRKGRIRLLDELLDWEPDAVLTLGASALNALAGGTKVLAISKERGRMRMTDTSWESNTVFKHLNVPWVPTISPGSVIRSPDLHRDIANDAYKVMAQLRPLPPMDIELHVPSSLLELDSALRLLEGASVVGVDVETTGLSPYGDELLAVGIGAIYDSDHGIAVVVQRSLISAAGQTEQLWDAVWRRTRRSVGHNFKFDMQFLAPLVGWAPEGASIGDTLLLSHLLDERPNRPTSRIRGLGLKDQVATRYDLQYGFDFGEFYAMPDDEKDWDAMHTYLGQDVCYTARLWHDLVVEAEAESPRLLECHDQLLMPVSKQIARCEWAGAPIDVSWVKLTIQNLGRRIERRQASLEQMIEILAPETKVDNVRSAQQIANAMYDEWKMTPDVRKHGILPEDDRSTDKDHVKAAVAKYLGGPLDRQARWLRALDRLRKDVRLQTTYQKSLLDRVDSDSRVRANFMIHGTSTGRLSSQGPNLQNIPSLKREDAERTRPMRRAFKPAEGREWVEVDYSQLELRVAAALSHDEALTKVFKDGRDIHQEVASAIFSKNYDKVTEVERYLSKAVGFGIIYGRGAKALATGVEMRYVEQRLGGKAWTVEQAEIFIRKFLTSYPKLAEWIEHQHGAVKIDGYVESPFGRRRRFPLTPKSRGEINAIERQAVNTPVQSAASDICLEAMTRVAKGIEFHELDATVLFPVHDSICIEVVAEDVQPLEALCRREMEVDFMDVPLTVSFEHGPSWAEVQ